MCYNDTNFEASSMESLNKIVRNKFDICESKTLEFVRNTSFDVLKDEISVVRLFAWGK